MNDNEDNNSTPADSDANKLTQTLEFSSIEDVCHGVKSYWRYNRLAALIPLLISVVLLIITFCFPLLAATIVSGFITFLAFISSLIQIPPEEIQQYRLIFVAIYLAISAICAICLCVPIYQSMERLYKTPGNVCLNARRLLNASWLLFAIAFCVTGFVIYFFDSPYRRILLVTSVILWSLSQIAFWAILGNIGTKIIPESKNGYYAGAIFYFSVTIFFILILFNNVLSARFFHLLLNLFVYITAISSIFMSGFIVKLQRRCTEILQTGIFTLPAPQTQEIQPRSVLRTGFDKLKSIRNLRLIILITICVFLLGATLYYRNAYPPEGQKINWSWSSLFSLKKKKSPYEEIQNWNDAVYKLNHGVISKELFVQWVYMSYLSDLESKYRSDTSEKLKEEYFRNSIIKEKIDCCMTFRKALKQESPEALQQVIENVYRLDLKEFKAEQENGWRHKVPLTKNNALILAVSMDDLEMAQWLVSVGADVNYKNRDEETPIQIAQKRNNQPMIQLLLGLGALH